MQQGILFDSLYTREVGVYFEQAGRTVHGAVDAAALRAAWQRVVDRHATLRTAFFWKTGREPFQVVHRRKELPWQEFDWREHTPDEQKRRLAAFLEDDRRRGFKLSAAPLMRVTLIRLAEETYYFVWSHHHLLMDGWSVSLVLKEVATYYAAWRVGQEPRIERPRPYRDYIAWCGQQQTTDAEGYWRRVLAGINAPTPLGGDEQVAAPHAHAADNSAPREDSHREVCGSVPRAVTNELRESAKRHRLTLYTITLGAWALLLSRYSGQTDVVCGTVVSGRPPDLAGVETMIGLFINVLPVRVHVPAASPVAAWLAQLQAQLTELRQYEYNTLVEVQGWSSVPRGRPMFESVVIFENYPTAQRPTIAGERRGDAAAAHAYERSNVPLSVIVEPGDELALTLRYDSRRFSREAVVRMHEQLLSVLGAMAADFAAPVESFSVITRSEQTQLTNAFNVDLGA
jgi:hypothetical protein